MREAREVREARHLVGFHDVDPRRKEQVSKRPPNILPEVYPLENPQVFNPRSLLYGQNRPTQEWRFLGLIMHQKRSAAGFPRTIQDSLRGMSPMLLKRLRLCRQRCYKVLECFLYFILPVIPFVSWMPRNVVD